MKENSKWLIAVDLDGTTLLDNNERNLIGKVNDFTKKVFKKMEEDGHQIVIDTGREWGQSKQIYEMLELNSYIINNAGTYIHNPSNNNMNSIVNGITKEQIEELTNDEYFKKVISGIGFATVDEMITVLKINGSDDYEKLFTPWGFKEINYIPEESLACWLSIDISKASPLEIHNYLSEKYGMDLDFINYDRTKEEGYAFMDINNRHWNKGKAILHLANKLGFDPEHTMGFGDGDNDIELLKQAKIGVAMQNASDKIKGVANVVNDYTNNQDGVARFLNEHFKLEIV